MDRDGLRVPCIRSNVDACGVERVSVPLLLGDGLTVSHVVHYRTATLKELVALRVVGCQCNAGSAWARTSQLARRPSAFGLHYFEWDAV